MTSRGPNGDHLKVGSGIYDIFGQISPADNYDFGSLNSLPEQTSADHEKFAFHPFLETA